MLDKTQGSFQKGVILFKSVIKASLIRLLNAACFLVVVSRGKNINWPLRSSTCGHACTHALHIRLNYKETKLRILAVARMVFVSLACPKKLMTGQDGVGS